MWCFKSLNNKLLRIFELFYFFSSCELCGIARKFGNNAIGSDLGSIMRDGTIAQYHRSSLDDVSSQ